MDAVEFCRWLQGFCELQEDNTPPTEKQWLLIKQHLQLVYNKETSSIGDEIEGIEKTLIALSNKQEKDTPMPFCLPANGQNNICSNSDE